MRTQQPLVFTIALSGLLALSLGDLRAQTKVEQHTISIDSATGKRTVTIDTIIKKEENVTPYTDMINVNPLKFFLAYNLSWVHKTGTSTAISVGTEYENILNNTSAWGILGEFRYYLSKKSLHGFYVAPNFSFTQSSNVFYSTYDPGSGIYSTGTYTAQMMSLGVLIGWQWFPADDFSMGFGIGVDDYIPLNQKTGDNYEDFNLLGGLYGKGTSPTLRFDLGYAW